MYFKEFKISRFLYMNGTHLHSIVHSLSLLNTLQLLLYMKQPNLHFC